MAGKGAVLAVRIVSDAKGATKGLRDTERAVGGFQQKLDRASVAAGGVLTGIAAIGKQAYEAASAAQQSAGAIETVYGKQVQAVKALAAQANDTVGLSKSSYQDLAALMGSQLKVGGIDDAALVPTLDTLMVRGADLAATFGGTTKDAVAALSSALKGERDPIERYGISLSQAAVDAEVSARGLDTSTDAAKKHAQTVATLGLILRQSSAANGAFAREADTAAGQTQRASAAFEDAKASLGEVLLPVVTAVAMQLSVLAGWMVRNKDVVLPLVGVVAGLAVAVLAVNAAVRTYSAITKVAAALQWIWNAAMAANPIMLIVLAVVALVAGVVLAYKKFAWFRDLVATVGDGLVWAFEKAKSAIAWVVDKLSFVGDAAGWVGDLFSASGTVSLTPVASGSAAGLFGAAAAGPVFGASSPLTALAGGRSPAGQGPLPTGPATIINVTVNGAVDPLATGRQLTQILREYAAATGGSVTLSLGGRA